MAMRYGTAGRLRLAGPGKDNNMEQPTHCLDVWEWEGGACGGSVDTALDPHATLYEYHPRGRGALHPWSLLTSAGRAVRSHAPWAGVLALGAGVVAVGLLRPR